MIIIVGAGEKGVFVANNLQRAGKKVVLIESCEDIVKDVLSKHRINVIHGDATSPEVLKCAGVDHADVVMALTPSDETNLMVCQFAKNMGARKVAANVNRSRNQLMFQALGIDVAVSPPLVLAYYFQAAAYGYSVIGTGDFDSIFVQVPLDFDNGVKVGDLRKKDAMVVSISRNGKMIDPSPDEIFEAGDLLALVGKRESCAKLAQGILERG